MRYLNSPIWARWRKPRHIGNDRARLVVTIEPDWFLTLSSHTNAFNSGTLGTWPKGPARWWQRKDNSQHEIEVPNIIGVEWDRSAETPVPSCTIRVRNQKMVDTPAGATSVGAPGYYSSRYGGHQRRPAGRPWVARPDKWGRFPNEWNGRLEAGNVFRTYEGYGPPDKPWQEAVEDGDIVLTGVWWCDRSAPRRDNIVLTCRGLSGPLLADQRLYTNSDEGIVPRNRWPLRYTRFVTGSSLIQTGSAFVKVRSDYQGSSTDITYPGEIVWYDINGRPRSRGAPIHGHFPDHAADSNGATYWFSEGYATPEGSSSSPWIEFHTWQKDVSGVRLHTLDGGYELYISVLEEGSWKGSNTVPYTAPSGGIDIAADIPYVKRVSVPANRVVDVELPRTYNAERIRVTFRKLRRYQWGTRQHHAGLRGFSALHREPLSPNAQGGRVTSSTWWGPGNYLDYADIWKDILLWAGYWLLPPRGVDGNHRARGKPEIFGNIETTGAYSDSPLPADMFDKRPPLDVITQLADIFSYLVMEGPEGEMHIHKRNIYEPGNDNEAGRRVQTIPLLHDATNLLDNAPVSDVTSLRSGITISTNEPTVAGDDVVTTRYLHPDLRSKLRGVRKPAMWINGVFIKREEQVRMAELLASRMWMASQRTEATMPGNPLIGPDDQVRISDRATGIDDVYYVLGVRSSFEVKTGRYTMTLSLVLMGDAQRWSLRPTPRIKGAEPAFRERRLYYVNEGDTWKIIYHRLQGRAYPGKVSIAEVMRMNVDKVPYGQEPTPGIFLDW